MALGPEDAIGSSCLPGYYDAAAVRTLVGAFSSAKKPYTTPATVAPTIGASQNIQSCASAQPLTNNAGPVLRAGFTDRFVTGMPIKWIKVSASPMAIGA